MAKMNYIASPKPQIAKNDHAFRTYTYGTADLVENQPKDGACANPHPYQAWTENIDPGVLIHLTDEEVNVLKWLAE
jgi:hypothetical protein